MGAAKRRKALKTKELFDDLVVQANEEVVQMPLQLDDGWFRGIPANWLPTVLEMWEQVKGDRQLWIYRIDKFWVKQKWKTPQGNFADRGDLIVEVAVNALAKELWVNTVSQPQFIETFRPQLESLHRNENGCVAFWWLQRYLLCRSVSPAQKLPVNYWEYYPIVEVHHPDGTVEQSAVDTTTFLQNSNKVLEQDPSQVEPAGSWEEKVFADCVKCEVIS